MSTGLRKQRDGVERFERRPLLDPIRLRALIDERRLSAREAHEFSMVVIHDVYLTGPHHHRQLDRIVAVYEAYRRAAAEECQDRFHIGWLGNNKLAILLPSGRPAPANQLAQQIVREADTPPQSITLCFQSVDDANASCTFQRRLVGEVRLQPLPWWKRCIDIAMAGTILVATAPIIILAGLAVRLTSKGPAIFGQRRIGAGGRPFQLFKLRTMYANAEKVKDNLRVQNERHGAAFKMENNPRVTPVGRFLRRTTIDQLPQLINVLRGEMSMVGPRPLPAGEWDPEESWYALRHDVTPGLTCHWQVDGRCRNATFDEWMRMDLDYVNQHTFRHDLKLILTTIYIVLFQRGSH